MADTHPIIFISGANRGIGYELARQMSTQSYQVIAGYRQQSQSGNLLNEAQNKENLIPFQVDITSADALQTLYQTIADQFGHLDILVNNAGVNFKRNVHLNALDWSDMVDHFNTNIGGAFLTTKTLHPLIKAGHHKKIINISSRLGSIALSDEGSVPYRMSKSGLNALTKQQAIAYQAEEITVISLSPGWVRTDMGGDSAPLSVQESATKIIERLDRISLSESGQFIDLDGQTIPY